MQEFFALVCHFVVSNNCYLDLYSATQTGHVEYEH